MRVVNEYSHGGLSTTSTSTKEHIDKNETYLKHFVLIPETPDKFNKLSIFVIHKAILNSIGEPRNIRKNLSGNMHIEVNNKKQSSNILKLKKIGNCKVDVSPHKTLNTTKGVISESQLYQESEEDILNNLKNSLVTDVRRIVIKKGNEEIKTKHIILTFNCPVLPKSIKVAYLNIPVKPYIPNPLRCYKCQKFGHSSATCRGRDRCARCSAYDHKSDKCSESPCCANCNGNHESYKKSCPQYKLKKEILSVKINQNITFHEAQKIVLARTPTSGTSYAEAAKKKVIESEKPSVTKSCKETQTKPTPNKKKKPGQKKENEKSKAPKQTKIETVSTSCEDTESSHTDEEMELGKQIEEDSEIKENKPSEGDEQEASASDTGIYPYYGDLAPEHILHGRIFYASSNLGVEGVDFVYLNAKSEDGNRFKMRKDDYDQISQLYTDL